jgi:hypothetical protein
MLITFLAYRSRSWKQVRTNAAPFLKTLTVFPASA